MSTINDRFPSEDQGCGLPESIPPALLHADIAEPCMMQPTSMGWHPPPPFGRVLSQACQEAASSALRRLERYRAKAIISVNLAGALGSASASAIAIPSPEARKSSMAFGRLRGTPSPSSYWKPSA